MKRMLVAAGLSLLSRTVFGQDVNVLLPREANAAALAELRGWQEELRPAAPGMLPAQPQSQSPFVFWTTAPLPRVRPSPETVSAASLGHRVPKAAKKASDRSAKFSRKGDSRRAAEELEKAVALDPEYAEAHGNLGFEYSQLGRLREAEAEMRRAIALDPYVSIAHSNLGWVLFQQGNFADAERSARHALALSLNNDRAHVLLGILLGAEPATRAEGARHLEQATSTFPQVKRLLDELRGR